jgi:hypothetical protein
VAGKGVGGRIQYKKCVHIYINAKMLPVETVPGIWTRGIKESSAGGKFKYDIVQEPV